MTGTSIICAGVEADIGSRVITWKDDGGLSFYKYGCKYGKRDKNLAELQNEIDSVVLHHSASWTHTQCYQTLLGRNLSCSFILSDINDENGNAIIFQTLDLKDAGFSQKPFNMRGIGIEICYYPEYSKNPNAYSEHNRKQFKCNEHPVREEYIHGRKMKMFGPSEAQEKALINLLYGINKLFPNIEMILPKGPDGKTAKTVIKDPKGLIYHMHITQEKWDPAAVSDNFQERLTSRLIYGE